MTDIFISYSRIDIAFTRLLHTALKDNGFESWIDWQDIPPSTKWLQEVFTAIEEANSLIFILSSASARSDVCLKEIQHAIKNNKRIIPIVIGEINADEVHPSLSERHSRTPSLRARCRAPSPLWESWLSRYRGDSRAP